jgi:hypothetical protein
LTELQALSVWSLKEKVSRGWTLLVSNMNCAFFLSKIAPKREPHSREWVPRDERSAFLA